MCSTSPLVYLALAFLILAGTRLAKPLPIDTAFSRFRSMSAAWSSSTTFPFILLMRFEPNGGWLVLLSMVVTRIGTGPISQGDSLGVTNSIRRQS